MNKHPTEKERKRLEAIQNYEIVRNRIENRNQEALELYLCSDDNRIRIIAGILGVSDDTINGIVNGYFQGRITFEQPNYIILNSHTNYPNQTQQWKK